MIVSIVTEKSFDKIKQLLTKRKQNKMNKQVLGTEAFFLNFTKGIFFKKLQKIALLIVKLELFPKKSGG